MVDQGFFCIRNKKLMFKKSRDTEKNLLKAVDKKISCADF